ncbi:glycosyltransferase [Helicobacter sp. 16-1353]|uniref:glycosyltransferase family 8 protein n=1 Tax=Helicobacter sp. 16-1353 TaxID=2004996 RepID=UPI0015EFB73D|nr:glycosyltransferase [Helicobacter sp. 16-1353]
MILSQIGGGQQGSKNTDLINLDSKAESKILDSADSIESKTLNSKDSTDSSSKNSANSIKSKNQNTPKVPQAHQLQESNAIKKSQIPLFYHLYILHNDIPAHYQDLLNQSIEPFRDFAKLIFINCQGTFEKQWQEMPQKSHFAKEVLYKILLQGHFAKYHKIIISDVDVVFLGDISQSFLDFDIESDVYISGVRANDPNGIFPLTGWKEGYKKFSKAEFEAVKYGVGGGYLIANLKKWRHDDIESKMIEYLRLNAHKLVLAEQDVLNIICYPKIATLSPAHIVGHQMWERYGERWEKYPPKVYSKNELDSARRHPIQLHYIGDKKPWNYPSEPKSELWYSYLAKTPFLKIFLANIECVIINNYIKTTLPYRLKALFKRNKLFFIDPRIYFKITKRIFKKIWGKIQGRD